MFPRLESATVNILAVLRYQGSMIPAHYKQYIKSGGTNSLKEYLRTRRTLYDYYSLAKTWRRHFAVSLLDYDKISNGADGGIVRSLIMWLAELFPDLSVGLANLMNSYGAANAQKANVTISDAVAFLIYSVNTAEIDEKMKSLLREAILSSRAAYDSVATNGPFVPMAEVAHLINPLIRRNIKIEGIELSAEEISSPSVKEVDNRDGSVNVGHKQESLALGDALISAKAGEFGAAAIKLDAVLSSMHNKKIGNALRRYIINEERRNYLWKTADREFFDLSDLTKSKCICCKSREIRIAPYPSLEDGRFAALLLLRCEYCGTSWIPEFSNPLSRNYQLSAAFSTNIVSSSCDPFYSEENLFWQSEIARRLISRADFHIKLLCEYSGKTDKILDLGAGMGILLSRIPHGARHGYECNEQCQKILVNELGVCCVDLRELNEIYDAIFCSHRLNFLSWEDVEKVLSIASEALREGGLLVLEVPAGADALVRLEHGKGNKGRLEPNSVNFSTIGLLILLKRVELEPVAASICGVSKRIIREGSSANTVLQAVEPVAYRPIVIVARKVGS